MTNPEQGIAPIRRAGLDNINRTYMDVAPRLASKFAARGYGSSGDFGSSLAQTEYQRGGAMSDFEAQIAQLINGNRNYGASLGTQLLNSGKGSTSTSTGPDTGFGDALQSTGNGLGNISTLLTLSKLLKGGGSGGNAGSTFIPGLSS